MATEGFILDFFPASAALLQRQAPQLWQWVFGTGETCQAHVLHLGTTGIALSAPSLALLCLFGAAVGTAGHRAHGNRLYGVACLAYAFMNLSALLCHCLVPRGASGHTALHGALRGLDVAFTCLSSASLLAATCLRDAPKTERKLIDQLPLLSGLVIALAVASNLGEQALPWINELLYVATTLAAFGAVMWREVFRQRLTPPQRSWIVAAGGIAVGGALCVVLDRPLCSAFGCHFTAVQAFFAGCAGSMYCLQRYAQLLGGAPRMRAKAA